ncbi:hypothetical protein LG299_03825 [Microbacterium lacus]|uniref:hypothetical protein n=1 Tax=Microbacterium lacus TaxID=415217 RepID=UPI00385162FC
MTDIAPSLCGATIPLVRAGNIHTTRETRTGALTRVTRGIYVATRMWAPLAPWERYRVRVQAAGMKHPDAVFHLESAASLHGLPIFGDPVRVHVLGDVGARARESGGVITHTTTQARGYESVGGMLACSLADTVVDIARARHPAVALAVADAALRQDPALTVEQLVAMNESRRSSRGRRRARWALHRATPLAESPLESIDRAVIEWLGFADPELQVWIGHDRVDKWWPEVQVAGESDGDLKYGGPAEQGNSALRDRHRRDARMFEHGVRAVPHWGWAEAVAVDPLEAILRSAGLRQELPRDAAPLFSLARALNPRPR